jgi:hypothetical protein
MVSLTLLAIAAITFPSLISQVLTYSLTATALLLTAVFLFVQFPSWHIVILFYVHPEWTNQMELFFLLKSLNLVMLSQ